MAAVAVRGSTRLKFLPIFAYPHFFSYLRTPGDGCDAEGEKVWFTERRIASVTFPAFAIPPRRVETDLFPGCPKHSTPSLRIAFRSPGLCRRPPSSDLAHEMSVECGSDPRLSEM